jgi:hypothetical protein
MEMLFTTRAERYALCPWPKEPPYHATKIHLYIMDCIHNVLFILNPESGIRGLSISRNEWGIELSVTGPKAPFW